jgi:hypothetical protein
MRSPAPPAPSTTRVAAAWAAIGGGLAWLPYGALELGTPLGADTAYDASRGYDAVIDRGLFVAYSLPGALAVVLCACALLALDAGGRGARVAAGAAAALGIAGAAGIALAFDPLFTAARIAGTLALAAATWLATAGLLTRAARAAFALLGAGLLVLWPLVFAVEVLTPGVAATIIAAYGAGWIAFGLRLRATAPAGAAPPIATAGAAQSPAAMARAAASAGR